MILDTSALVAMILREDGAESFDAASAAAAQLRISAATLVEATMVLEGRSGTAAGEQLELWLTRLGVEVQAVSERTARLAQDGWRRYGKGRHPASLNFGDCFSYALAVERDEPLLFKGEDFARTDVKAAIA